VNVDENALAKKHLIERPQFQTADGLFRLPDTSSLRGSPDPNDSPTTGPPNFGNGPPNIHMVSRNDPHADEVSGVPVLISAELNGDEIHVEYMIHYPYSDSMMVEQGMPQQRLTSSIAIPVETKSVGDTTRLRLHNPDGRDNEQLEKLSATSERTSYLRQTYGHLPMASAVELANDGLTEAYRSVSLFGFAFSTRRLPFAILAFFAAALFGTLLTLIAARRQGNAVLANPIDEYALDMLLGNTPGRIFVWIVVPISALLASHPLVPLPKHDTFCLSIGLIVVAALGVGCTWLSQGSRPATAN
jgi:hypothetical protein